MTRNAGWSFGTLWLDNALPTAVGASCALVVIYLGGPFWSLLVMPLLCWCIWQLTRRFRAKPSVQIGLVTSVALIVIACAFLLFGVDTAKLHQAVSGAGILVSAVSSDRSAVVINIQPVSWGPERNAALRAIFAAAHTYAKSKKRVIVQWGDAMTSTIVMNDIAAFLAGQITYREILNRMEWHGTPNVLPDESSELQASFGYNESCAPISC